MRKVLFLLTLFALAAGAVLAQVESPQENTTNTAELRVLNAMVGIGPVDVYLNERPIGLALPAETATAYLALPPGQYIVAVYPAGADPLSVPIADILIDLPVGHSKTAVVYQSRFAPSEEDVESSPPPVAQSGSVMVLDDNRSPMTLGKTRLTALHLAPGTPGKLSIAYPSRASLLHEISLNQPYGDIDIDAGVYPLTIVDAESQNLTRLAFIGERIFQANVHYTLVIVPDIRPEISRAGDRTEQQLPQLATQPRLFIISAPTEPPADGFQLRFIHTAYNTAVVDLYIDNRLVAPRLNYGQYTEYIGLPSFSHLIELRRRDAPPDSEPLASAEFELTEENRRQPHWSLLLLNANNPEVTSLELVQAQDSVNAADARPTIFNTPGGPMTLVLLPDNIAQTARGSARVRVIHAIDGALEISMFALGFPPDPDAPILTPTPGPTPTPQPPVRIVDPVIYGVEANENEVRAGLYGELDFVAGSTTEILTLVDHQLLPGMVHTFVLIGQPSGEPPITALEIRDFGRGLPQERLYVGVVTVAGAPGIANVRRLPSDAAGVIDQLPNGTEVEVLGRNFDGTWIRVRYTRPGVNAPQEGWIFGRILRVTRLGDAINVLSLPRVN